MMFSIVYKYMYVHIAGISRENEFEIVFRIPKQFQVDIAACLRTMLSAHALLCNIIVVYYNVLLSCHTVPSGKKLNILIESKK